MNLVTEHLTIRELRMEDLTGWEIPTSSCNICVCSRWTAKAPETTCNR